MIDRNCKKNFHKSPHTPPWSSVPMDIFFNNISQKYFNNISQKHFSIIFFKSISKYISIHTLTFTRHLFRRIYLSMIFPNIFISVFTPPWSSVLKDIFLTYISKYISVHTQQQSCLIISKYFPNNKDVFFQSFLQCIFSLISTMSLFSYF